MDTSLSIVLLKKIIVMFIMVAMGFLTVKRGRLKSTDSSVISRLCFDWVIPCSLIASFNTPYDSGKAQGFLFACAIAIFSILLYIFITRLVQKPLKFNVSEQGTAIFSNSAGVGAPLVAAVLGDEAIFFAAAHMGFQNLAIFLYLPMIMSREAKIPWKKIFLNRNVFSIVIGLAIFFSGFQLPEIIGGAVKTVGSLLSPLSMFMIGMLMGGVEFKKLFSRGRFYLVTAARLIIYPFILMLIVKITGALNWFPDVDAYQIVLIILICSSAPAAALVTQMADVYRTPEEAQDAGTLNVITTLFCIITMPLLVFIYQLIM